MIGYKKLEQLENIKRKIVLHKGQKDKINISEYKKISLELGEEYGYTSLVAEITKAQKIENKNRNKILEIRLTKFHYNLRSMELSAIRKFGKKTKKSYNKSPKEILSRHRYTKLG